MAEIKTPFELPNTPVDGFQVNWFINRSGKIIEYLAIYHINTKWTVFNPNKPDGLDIIDQWIIYEDGFPISRRNSWLKLIPFNEPFFETKNAVSKDAILFHLRRIDTLSNQIKIHKADIKKLKAYGKNTKQK